MKCPCCNGTGEAPDPVRGQPGAAFRAIERYYRARAAGDRRMTLKRLAQETGYSPGYLGQVKFEYDRAGKWGSKKAKA